MATDYPGALDTTKLTNPATTDKRNSPSHAGLHANAQDAIKALEAKVGTGASTPVVSTLLFGTGTGTSAWTQLTSAQLAASLSDETGTGSAVFATTPTLVTPKVDTINESTPSNGVTVSGVNMKSGAVAATGAITAATTLTTTTGAVASGSANHLALSAGTSKLVKTTVLRQDDTTNSYQTGNTVTLTGWGVGVPGAIASLTETVTFGVTFTQRPIVIAVFGGDNISGTLTYGAGTGARKSAFAEALAITTTSFSIIIKTNDATSWTAGDSVFYQWMATGEI